MDRGALPGPRLEKGAKSIARASCEEVTATVIKSRPKIAKGKIVCSEGPGKGGVLHG
jgi:hypothetical protein